MGVCVCVCVHGCVLCVCVHGCVVCMGVCAWVCLVLYCFILPVCVSPRPNALPSIEMCI